MRGEWRKWLILVMSLAIWGAVLTNVPAVRAWVPSEPIPTPTVPPPLPPPPTPEPTPTPVTPPPTSPPCHNMPEPSTLILGLIAGGTIGLGAIRRRFGK